MPLDLIDRPTFLCTLNPRTPIAFTSSRWRQALSTKSGLIQLPVETGEIDHPSAQRPVVPGLDIPFLLIPELVERKGDDVFYPRPIQNFLELLHLFGLVVVPLQVAVPVDCPFPLPAWPAGCPTPPGWLSAEAWPSDGSCPPPPVHLSGTPIQFQPVNFVWSLARPEILCFRYLLFQDWRPALSFSFLSLRLLP